MSFLTPSEELQIFRGKDYRINDHIFIHIPTLGEISDYGESEYYSFVKLITATPTDLCYQLWDKGIDYTLVTDYQLFTELLIHSMTLSQSKILFGNLDFSKFKKDIEPKNGATILRIPGQDWFIDECTYEFMTDCLRSIHFFEKNVSIPANEGTKIALIEDARDAAIIQSRKEHHSYLINLVSTMVNMEGFKYNHDNVWDVKINVFMDSVLRIGKIKNANLLLQSGYSGFGINLKEINKNQLDWMGPLT